MAEKRKLYGNGEKASDSPFGNPAHEVRTEESEMEILTRVTRTVTTEEVTSLQIDGDELRAMLKKHFPQLAAISEKMEIRFQVPGGADWSGEFIDVDRDNPLHVSVVVRKTEKS